MHMDQTSNGFTNSPYDAEKAAPQGRLKIFLAMQLVWARPMQCWKRRIQAKKEGIDVVVGYVEPHARPDTLALLTGLEVLPNQVIDYRASSFGSLISIRRCGVSRS